MPICYPRQSLVWWVPWGLLFLLDVCWYFCNTLKRNRPEDKDNLNDYALHASDICCRLGGNLSASSQCIHLCKRRSFFLQLPPLEFDVLFLPVGKQHTTLTGLIQLLFGGSRSKIFAHSVAVFHPRQNLIFFGYVASRWHELCERNW